MNIVYDQNRILVKCNNALGDVKVAENFYKVRERPLQKPAREQGRQNPTYPREEPSRYRSRF